MRRYLAAGTGIVLLLGAISMAWRARPSDRSPENDRRTTRRDSEASPHESSARRSSRDERRTTGPDAAVRLRALINAPPTGAPDFSHLESLVEKLRDEGFPALLEKTRTHPPDSVAARIRCALFAEMARRDPAAAME